MFSILYAEGVVNDLSRIRKFERTKILDQIDQQLQQQPAAENRNRKLLPGFRPPWEQELPVWELRVGEWRVFYDVDVAQCIVTVRAIRHKPPHATTEDIL